MPRRTLTEIAELHGLTKDALTYAKSQGVNVYRDEEVAAWAEARRAKSDSKCEAPGTSMTDMASVGLGQALSIEELEQQLVSAVNPQIAQMRKIQIQGLRDGLRYRQDRQELISLPEIRERDTRIANAVRAACIKLENELPPKGVGLDEAGMQKAFRPVIHAILSDLSDAQSDFWKDKPE